jgi:hypothetical protein
MTQGLGRHGLIDYCRIKNVPSQGLFKVLLAAFVRRMTNEEKNFSPMERLFGSWLRKIYYD